MMTIPVMVPDTLDYLIAGYAVITLITSGYIVSLIWRRRKIRRELFDLENRNARN
jgi:CcmD family protein